MTIREESRSGPAFPALAVIGAGIVALGTATVPPIASADNDRLNNGIAHSIYVVRHQAGCTTELKTDPALELAAQRHAEDLLNNRDVEGDIGSDGSTAQDRARTAGYSGAVAETVAILASAAINGMDILTNWYHRPDYYAIMSSCANTHIGVRSVNAPDRSVAVAIYGQPN